MKNRLLLSVLLLFLLVNISYSQCTERRPPEISISHVKLALEMQDIFDQEIPDRQKEMRTSEILGEMYTNFCKGKEVTYVGKLARIFEPNDESHIKVVIEDSLSNNSVNLLIQFLAGVHKESKVAKTLMKNYEEGEIIMFKFRATGFFNPEYRSAIAKEIVKGNASSFPLSTPSNSSLNARFPITISLTEINNPDKLFDD